MELEHKHLNLQTIIGYSEDNIQSIKTNSERVIAAGYVGSRAQGLEIDGSDHDVWLITVPSTDRLVHLNDSKDKNKLTVKYDFNLDLLDQVKGADGVYREKYIESKVQLSVIDIRKFLRSLVKPNLRCFEFLTNNYIVNANNHMIFDKTLNKTMELFDYLSLHKYRLLQANLQGFAFNIRGLISQRVKDCDKWLKRFEDSDKKEADVESLLHLVTKEYAHIQRLNYILKKSKELYLDNGGITSEVCSEIYENLPLTGVRCPDLDEALTESQYKYLRSKKDYAISSKTSEKEVMDYVSYPLYYSQTTLQDATELVEEMSNEIIRSVNSYLSETTTDPLEEFRIRTAKNIDSYLKKLVETYIGENILYKTDCQKH